MREPALHHLDRRRVARGNVAGLRVHAAVDA
jgi:hypothetical protein